MEVVLRKASLNIPPSFPRSDQSFARTRNLIPTLASFGGSPLVLWVWQGCVARSEPQTSPERLWLDPRAISNDGVFRWWFSSTFPAFFCDNSATVTRANHSLTISISVRSIRFLDPPGLDDCILTVVKTMRGVYADAGIFSPCGIDHLYINMNIWIGSDQIKSRSPHTAHHINPPDALQGSYQPIPNCSST